MKIAYGYFYMDTGANLVALGFEILFFKVLKIVVGCLVLGLYTK